MGKLVTFIAILIFIDLLFLITGQLTLDSPSSAIINVIQEPELIKTTGWWAILVTGLSLLLVTATVVVGFVNPRSDLIIFFAMASALTVLVGDYVVIYNHLASFNKPLAILIMAPIITMFAFIIIEWARGKD